MPSVEPLSTTMSLAWERSGAGECFQAPLGCVEVVVAENDYGIKWRVNHSGSLYH